MIPRITAVLFFLFAQFLMAPAFAADYNIKDYGAKADGHTISTIAIQKAIDACTANGGGRVIVPDGTYLTGTVMLKSNVELHLESRAVILGSTQLADYPLTTAERGLVMALEQVNVSISGTGEINGNGKAFFKGDNSPDRPLLVMFKKCRHINISGVNLKSPAFWTFRLLYNDDVMVSGIHIYAHVNFNNDGIDIDSKNVVITNCIVDTDDDALCFKSDSTIACENVTVTNCVLASNCNFIKMGTASFGGFKNISVNNCALRKASESNFRFWDKNVPGVKDAITGLAGIAIEAVDGAAIDGINISNIVMNDVQTPLFIRLGNRRNATGSLKNVVISHIIAKTRSTIPSSITAVPGFYVENVILDDFLIENLYSEQNFPAGAVPENIKDYPENRMFGVTLPSCGLYVRHAKNIALNNFQLHTNQADARPALHFEDVETVKINSLNAAAPANRQPLIRLDQVSDLFVSGHTAKAGSPLFLNVSGAKSEQIILSGNSLNNYKEIVTTGAGVKKDAVIQK